MSNANRNRNPLPPGTELIEPDEEGEAPPPRDIGLGAPVGVKLELAIAQPSASGEPLSVAELAEPVKRQFTRRQFEEKYARPANVRVPGDGDVGRLT